MKQERSSQSQSFQHRRGIALMLVMVAILVVGAMAVAYFGSRDNSIAISTNVASSSRARIVAESGLDLAVAILETNSDWRTNHIDGVILQNQQLSDGVITITFIDSETELPPTESTFEVSIFVSSTVDGRTQITEATATIIPDDNQFDVDYSEFAIFAQNRIELLGAASIQNWSSSPVLSQQQIQIGTLATNPMSVQIESQDQAKLLHLLTPENASSMIAGSSMSSRQFTDVLPFLSPPSPPSEFQTLLLQRNNDEVELDNWVKWYTSSQSDFNGKFDQTITLTEGSYAVEGLTLTSAQPIEIQGDVVITVEEDVKMNHASITLVDGASLTMHIGGILDIKSSYIGNENHSTQSWMDPSRVKLYGHNDENWIISGYSTVKAELYAPSSSIDIRGNSTICGRIAGLNVSLRGASRVLYDPLLNNGGFADEESMLYNEDGTLLNEVRQLTELNPVLLDAIERVISENHMHSDDDQFDSFGYSSWRLKPTDRPNEVIYMLVVYGVDAKRWETLARKANRYATVAGIDIDMVDEQ